MQESSKREEKPRQAGHSLCQKQRQNLQAGRVYLNNTLAEI